MLDINFILENTDLVKQNIKNKNIKCDLDEVLHAYKTFKNLVAENDENNRQMNENTKEVVAQKGTLNVDKLISRGRTLKEKAKTLADELAKSKAQWEELALTVPNIMAEDTPIAEDASGNVEVEKFLEPTKFDFKPKTHIELGKDLDLIDMERASKVAGPKFYYLKNQLVILQMALEMFAMNKLIKKGFTPIFTPDVARTNILMGSGFNPRGAESNIYKLEELDLNLIATAEITIGGYHSGEQLKLEDLPLKYAGFSHCFRREAGAPGKNDAGLYRVHQFSKVEMYQFTTVADGERALQELLGIEKEIFQDLKIPYHIVRICSGDMGAPAYKKYDIEAWMPGRGAKGDYGEVTSVGNFTTFQSRRLNITYIDKDGKKQFINTLNGTAIALTRTILAIMENYQQEDGSIAIPKVLQAYTGFAKIEKKK
jgi:seryl-tRNA synthetase